MLDARQKKNFELLLAFARDEEICLVEGKRRSDGEIVPLVCAAYRIHDTGEIQLVPLAELVDCEDPFFAYLPPEGSDGFRDLSEEDPA